MFPLAMLKGVCVAIGQRAMIGTAQEKALETASSPRFSHIMVALAERRDLTEDETRNVMRGLLEGHWDDAEAAALLTGLRIKGETAVELAAAARVLREHMIPFDCGDLDVLDTCGTGGDGAKTFNISTTAALVAAGAGVPVVKHGNRAMSSHSGSADVLAVLGVRFDGDSSRARCCLDRAGLAFCFAPNFHPALALLGPVRRRLGIRTIFNCLGPLANPARAPYQLIGVSRPDMLEPMAGALARLGCRRAFLVCGQDGLDEVSLSAPTLVREVRGGTVFAHEWSPGDFDLQGCALADLQAEGPEESAAIILSVLNNEDGPASRIVLANAAAALLAAERVNSLLEGVQLARQSLATGKARRVLDLLIAHSHEESTNAEGCSHGS